MARDERQTEGLLQVSEREYGGLPRESATAALPSLNPSMTSLAVRSLSKGSRSDRSGMQAAQTVTDPVEYANGDNPPPYAIQ
jgi:hypothetical protein